MRVVWDTGIRAIPYACCTGRRHLSNWHISSLSTSDSCSPLGLSLSRRQSICPPLSRTPRSPCAPAQVADANKMLPPAVADVELGSPVPTDHQVRLELRRA